MSKMKVSLLILSSIIIINLKKIEVILDLENQHRMLKIAVFDSPETRCLTNYQKVLSECLFRFKNPLNITCLTMKFHNCQHLSKQENKSSENYIDTVAEKTVSTPST